MQATSVETSRRSDEAREASVASSALAPAPNELPAARLALPAGQATPEQEAEEQYRWLRLLVWPFVIAAAFFAATIATADSWLLGPAIVLGPIFMMGAFVYLMLSSDANHELGAPLAVPHRPQPRRRRRGRAARPRVTQAGRRR